MSAESLNFNKFPHTLNKADFMSRPEEMKEYEVDDLITRDNLVSFLMKSFAVSRGRVEVQLLFFKWIQRRQGFDYVSSIKALVDAGGWNAFTEEEQERFLSGFRHIKKHTDKWLDFEHEDEILNEIEALIYRKNPMGKSEEFIDVSSINSFSEFVSATSAYITACPLARN